jgi:uncharacterized protein (DUF305 family)
MKRMMGSLLALSVALTLGWGFAQGAGHDQHHGAGQAGMAGSGMAQLESEFDFLVHMISHHQEAVESARQIAELTEREEVRQLAQEIIEVQTREIETMEGWLEAWYPGRERDAAYEPMMRDLTGLSPDEADRAFLEGMIEHHRMAVMDAQQLLDRGLAEHDEVAAMARDIIEVQTREIAELQTWLRDWFSGGAAQGMMGQGMMGQGMMGQGMMGQGMMPPDMMGMHPMMQHCMAMMSQGDMPMSGMMGQATPGMMGTAARYDQQDAQALARAFLAGSRPGADITAVEPPQTLYRVTFQDGDATGVLVVDATTGEVRLEQGD